MQRIMATVLLASLALGASPRPSDKMGEDAPTSAAGRLNAVLAGWEKVAAARREAHFKFRITQHNQVFQYKETYQGEAFAKKPKLVRVDVRKAKGEPDYTVLFTLDAAHVLNFNQQMEMVLPRPPDPGFLGKQAGRLLAFDGIWLSEALHQKTYWVAAGLPVSDLRKRFDLRLTRDDEHWATVEVRPRNRDDGKRFSRIQVLLEAKTHRVRRIGIEEATGVTTTYEFERPEIGPVTEETLRRGLPKGWERITFPLRD